MAVSLVKSDIESGSDARASARTNLYLGAVIGFGGHLAPTRIRDLSRVGAKVEGAMLPGAGHPVQLQRGKLIAKGEVAWNDGARCGVRFFDPINLDAWLPTATPARTQADVDLAIAQIRSGGPQSDKADGQALSELAESLPLRLAEEIQCIVRTLETVQERLATEPLMLARHGLDLQQLNISGELLEQIAGLLIAPDMQRAVETIALEGLRRRLTRSSI